MKRILLIGTFAMLVAFSSRAAYYLVGDIFGGWDPGAGVEMTEHNDGTYHYNFTVNGSIWFVFADSLDSDWASFNANHRYGPIDGDENVTFSSWHTTQRSSSNGAYHFSGFDSNFEIVFNPATCQFIINPEMSPGLSVYTVVGTPPSVFGTEWDINNTDNDMVKQGGLYHWTKTDLALSACTIEFKIVLNHDWFQSWPNLSYIEAIQEEGIYTIDITFDPEADDTNNISCNIIKTGPPVKGDLNGDNEVNIADVNLLIDAILDATTETAYDVNNDSEINIADINALIDIILNTLA